MSKNRHKIKRWFGRKFRLVLYLSESLEAKASFRFSRLGIILLNLALLILLFWGFWMLISRTSLKEEIPGFPTNEAIEHMYTNKVRIDSLEEELRLRDQYLNAIRNMLLGIDSIDNNFLYTAQGTPADSLMQVTNEQNKGGIWVNQAFKNPFPNRAVIHLFPPLQGMITNKFNPGMGHFGTDIVAQTDVVVKAARQGTVIAANFTVETGYTLIIQHDMGIITIYRHNQSIMVKTGEKVVAGQPVAVMGNTGEYSTGEHLHFEVWIEGKPVNPEDYTAF
ncbi:MAG TPA: M23 family metallopeptidase [Bacteroidales bacterium]|mgnify:CR=1 FL=1|nr:M23 family metallopeptidase [Bacteroidales bacterium]